MRLCLSVFTAASKRRRSSAISSAPAGVAAAAALPSSCAIWFRSAAFFVRAFHHFSNRITPQRRKIAAMTISRTASDSSGTKEPIETQGPMNQMMSEIAMRPISTSVVRLKTNEKMRLIISSGARSARAPRAWAR